MAERRRWILIAAVLGSSIVFLDSTVVNVALPRIGRELPRIFLGVLEGQSYIYNGYLLTLCAVLILAGALTDYYGRKRTFLLGLAGFGITSVLCGFAPNMELLVLFRVFQGVAGAFLVPGSLALITSNFEGEEQGRAYGVWAAGSAATTLLGPVVGGFLVDSISWRAAFFINVPIILVALWATNVHVPESRDEQASPRFDWFGAVIVALAVGGLAFGTIYGEQRNWTDPVGFIALGIGAISTAVVPLWMARSPHPLIPLQLFKSRNFSVTNVSTFLIYGSLYVTFYYLGLFAQGTLGYTAAAAGLSGIAGSLFMIFGSSRFGTLASRYGPRWFMAIGPAIMALGVLWYVRIPASSMAWHLQLNDPRSFIPPGSYFIDLFPASIVFGIGIMVTVAPLTTALMTSVPAHNSGLASAINNAISRIGPQLLGAVVFIFITDGFYRELATLMPGLDVHSLQFRQMVSPLNPSRNPAMAAAVRLASTDAFHLAALVGAALLLAGALVNAVGIRNLRPAVKRPQTQPQPGPSSVPAKEPA